MFLRVIVDHSSASLANLRQREVDFCIAIIRERVSLAFNCFRDAYDSTVVFQWTDIQVIGRDLARLLQDVSRIPVFEKLWKDILLNPTNVHPEFRGNRVCST